MRGLLTIRWNLIIIVVVASALSLIGLMLTGVHTPLIHTLVLVVVGAQGALLIWLLSRAKTAMEKWNRTILNRLPMPLGILDTNSRWIYVDPALAALLANGDSRAMIGRHCSETAPENHSRFLEQYNTPEAEEVKTVDLPLGERDIYRVSSFRLLDTAGKYMGRLVVGQNVTDAKEIQRTLGLASSIVRGLDAGAERILAGAHSLADSAMEKSAAIEEITSTTQKIGDASATYVDSARNSHLQAESTHAASDRGATEALQAAAAMNGVRESGHKIRSIIKLIDDIAFQTNLLALNAAVEAARAGRHGRGFAVVADEVRNLAGRSARAARETSSMIEEMAERIGDATDAIERLGGTLVEIKENAEFLRANSDEVARVADQQSQAVHQVHISLEQISRAVNATIVVSRETSNLAEIISRQSTALRRITHDVDPSAPATDDPAMLLDGAEDAAARHTPVSSSAALLPYAAEDTIL